MNSPVSGSLQWTWPPDEALNSLVNYNSELAFIPSPLHSVQNQEASYLDASSKLPTKLSRNPTIYEKELRQIVIDLYSEREEERKPEQIPDTSSFTEMSILQESVETMEDHRKLSSLVPGAYQDNGLGNLMIGAEASHTPERRGGFLMEGSSTPSMEKSLVDGITYTERVKAPQPLDMVRMMETSKGSSEVGSEGYFSQDYNSSATDESEMQSVEDLQGYLMKYQSSKDGKYRCFLLSRLHRFGAVILLDCPDKVHFFGLIVVVNLPIYSPPMLPDSFFHLFYSMPL